MWWLNDKAALSAKERSTCVDASTAINSLLASVHKSINYTEVSSK